MINILKKINHLLLLIILSGCQTHSLKTALITDSKSESYELNIALPFGINSNIYYDQADWLIYAKQIETILNKSLLEVSAYIKPRKNLQIEIVLIDPVAFSAKISESNWVNAAFHKGQIYIPIKNNTKQFMDGNLINTLKHELTHAINYDLSNGYIPAWLDEGLALLIENQPEIKAKKRYKEWLRLNSPIKLEKLEKGFTKFHFDQAGYAYIQSKFMVSYLLKRFGTQGLQVLIENFSKYRDSKTTFVKTFGMSLTEFEEHYASKIKLAIKSGVL